MDEQFVTRFQSTHPPLLFKAMTRRIEQFFERARDTESSLGALTIDWGGGTMAMIPVGLEEATHYGDV